MFKRIIILTCTAACLAAAMLLIFGFTGEQKASRVGNFLCAEFAETHPAPSAELHICAPVPIYPPNLSAKLL